MNKNIRVYLSLFLVAFYFVIVFYFLFAVANIDILENFMAGMVFEAFGAISLVFSVLYGCFGKGQKFGFIVGIIFTSLIYSIVLDIVNTTVIFNVSKTTFVFINLVVLFIYLCIILPIYMMANKDIREEI